MRFPKRCAFCKSLFLGSNSNRNTLAMSVVTEPKGIPRSVEMTIYQNERKQSSSRKLIA